MSIRTEKRFCSRCQTTWEAQSSDPKKTLDQLFTEMGGFRKIDGVWVCGKCLHTGKHYHWHKSAFGDKS